MSPEVTQRIGYAPITRIDPARREIEVTATSEALDAYGTIFAYEASRAAFARWLGNVREMHDAVAVGKRIAVRDDPDRRAIRVRLRISQGAESTWQKILDGTLCGASIGAANVTWQDLPRDQLPAAIRAEPDLPDTVRVATAYDLVELSLVDSPANPDCLGVTLVRAALPDLDLLDPLEDSDPAPDPTDTLIDPATSSSLPSAVPSSHDANRVGASPATPCPHCGHLAPHDNQKPLSTTVGRGWGGATPDPLTPLSTTVGRGWEGATPDPLAPLSMRSDSGAWGGAGGGAVLAAVERLARDQRAQLADLATRLARIEAQPLPGGPILRAAEKTLGFTGPSQVANLAERIAALQTFAASATDQRTQVEIAAEILRLQRGE